MKQIRQAIVLVDAYRRPSRKRNTAGRYRVGAKTEREAEELVREAIGFGSVKFYCWEDNVGTEVKYKQVVKEIPSSRLVTTDYSHERPRHACEPLTK